MGSANTFAYLALLLWLPISFVGISMVRPTLACASLMIGAVMFLPNRVIFDVPGMPPIGKEEVASIGLLLACIIRYPTRLVRAAPGRGLEALIFALVLAGLGTVATNGDTLTYGPTVLRPLTNHDALSMGVRDLIRYAIPFFLGRAFFRRPSDLKDLMLVLSCAALLYSIFIFYELRMSPTLHRDLYGMLQHGFAGAIRWGGYRPMVFMASGLALAHFLANSVIASAALARARIRIFGFSARLVTGYLLAVLLLCKSVAAISYGLIGAPLVLLSRARFQARIAMLLAAIVFAYPLLRSYDVFPTGSFLGIANAIDTERADSLAFRFDHEDRLLAKANQRPIFGWGGDRRSRIFNEVTGRDESVTDGAWVIFLGTRGVVGFGAIFGLLLLPIFQTGRVQARVVNERDRLMLSGAALLIAISSVDLLPNGMFTNFIVFQCGCLAGAVRGASLGSSRHARRSPRRLVHSAGDPLDRPAEAGAKLA